MKKGILLLALIFTACVNLEDIGGNSGGEVKEGEYLHPALRSR